MNMNSLNKLLTVINKVFIVGNKIDKTITRMSGSKSTGQVPEAKSTSKH